MAPIFNLASDTNFLQDCLHIIREELLSRYLPVVSRIQTRGRSMCDVVVYRLPCESLVILKELSQGLQEESELRKLQVFISVASRCLTFSF